MWSEQYGSLIWHLIILRCPTSVSAALSPWPPGLSESVTLHLTPWSCLQSHFCSSSISCLEDPVPQSGSWRYVDITVVTIVHHHPQTKEPGQWFQNTDNLDNGSSKSKGRLQELKGWKTMVFDQNQISDLKRKCYL